MLVIRQQRPPGAAWAERGLPPLVHPDDPELHSHLYWSLTELSNAAEQHDAAAADCLADAAEAALNCLIRNGRLAARATAVALPLWGELCRAVGAEQWEQTALHAATLRHLVPPGPPRLPGVVAPYVPPAIRVKGGRLPLVTSPAGAAGRAPHEQLLVLIAAALAAGAGHLVEHTATHPSPPAGLLPARTGWTAGHASGILLGGYRAAADGAHPDELVLRPGACTAAANRLDPHKQWTVRDAGEALADAWITDTTLVVRGRRLRRLLTVDGSVQREAPREGVWVLPADLYAAGQFGNPHAPRRPGRARRLRPLPGGLR